MKLEDIDLNKFTEQELLALNRGIVARLKALSEMRTQTKMLQFHPGQRVTFQSSDGRDVVGVITKQNRKTVSVLSDDRTQWNVSPGFLRPISKSDDDYIDAKIAKN